ncbi:photosynthetic complex assembly protein PuhC [Sandaracinobacteroides saxicola]|uniref:Phosphonoacetaldehyde methylase n=1 Tax=Sandaracinobacteroides saxicola TaxID=2759707 RepID=A0A7G5IKT6_9SPHN|nr:photosynthetic complex assembly protein PuhC [Sandaracinobacteroides saxicola]QMW23978.1 phosphonoacetaldehyde methylase [Sandaracinobacteroides saxicola]
MSHDHHAEPFPRAMLLLAGGLIATTLLLTTAVRLGWVAQSADPVALRAAAQTKALASRDLRFLDAPGGGVQILDAKTGAVAGSVQAGSTNGFIRGVMRGLARERRLAGKSPETPFRLTAWANGELSLTDLATGRVIEVGSFGATNRNAFAALLPGIAPLPTPPSP